MITSLLFFFIFYFSGIQPGVRVIPGISEDMIGAKVQVFRYKPGMALGIPGG
jgi:hypothetical protein